MDPAIPEPTGPLLPWLQQNPEALPRLVRFYNRFRKLEIHVTSAGVTQKFTVQAVGESAVIKIEV